MKFSRDSERLTVCLSIDDMDQLAVNGSIGIRDGVFGSDSKINVHKPRGREDRLKLRNCLARLVLDPGYDMHILIDPDNQPQNGFAHEVPRDALLVSHHDPSVTEKCIPVGGVIIEVEPSKKDEPSIYTKVTEVEADKSEIVPQKACWHQPIK